MSTDKIAQFQEAFERGAATIGTLFEHYKRKDFTPEDYGSFLKRRETPKIQERIAAFYEGKLFQAQTQTYDDWCNAVHADGDRRRADDFEQMSKSTGIDDQEIRNFIKLMVRTRRIPIEKQDEGTLTEREAARGFFGRILNSNGWVNWPKAKPQENA